MSNWQKKKGSFEETTATALEPILPSFNGKGRIANSVRGVVLTRELEQTFHLVYEYIDSILSKEQRQPTQGKKSDNVAVAAFSEHVVLRFAVDTSERCHPLQPCMGLRVLYVFPAGIFHGGRFHHKRGGVVVR